MEINETVDTTGMNCPKPLIETKKKLRKMAAGQVLKVIGDHGVSKVEIPDAMTESGEDVLEVKELDGSKWEITIRKA